MRLWKDQAIWALDRCRECFESRCNFDRCITKGFTQGVPQSEHVERSGSVTCRRSLLADQVWTSRAANLSRDKKSEPNHLNNCVSLLPYNSSTQASLHNDCRSPRGALKGYEPKVTVGGCRNNDGTATSSDDNNVSPSKTRRIRNDLLYSV